MASFRNEYNPRIAVTVDMIATGTDVKPLECLLFMRDVRSKNYFEQMKGRGTRTLGYDDLKKVTPSAYTSKTGFIIVDAVGVTKSIKTDSRPLERKKTVPLKDLLQAVLMGQTDEDTFLSLAGRLARLDRQITPAEKEKFSKLANGKSINAVVHRLLNAHNPDKIEAQARSENSLSPDAQPTDEQKEQAQQTLIDMARNFFNGELNEFIENVRKTHDQIIDRINIDEVKFTGWDSDAKEKADSIIADFKAFIEANRDEIAALSIFYNQPYNLRQVTHQMVKELLVSVDS